MPMRSGLNNLGFVALFLLVGGCSSFQTTRWEDPAGIATGDQFLLRRDVMLTEKYDLVPWSPAEIDAYRLDAPEWRERRNRYLGIVVAGTKIEYRKALAVPDINTGAVVRHVGRVLAPSPWAGRTVLLDAVLFPQGHGQPYSTNLVSKIASAPHSE